MELPPSPVASSTVYGTVTDGTSPLADATVKLFDSTGMPYRHTLTDAAGAFSISDIPAGTYSLAAVKDGYLLSDAAGVTLSAGDSISVDLQCIPDATLSLGTIAGVLTTTNTLGISVPLAGAKITLKDALGVTVAVTATEDDGEFAFYDLADGIYSLTSSADGYLPSASMTAVITGGSVANISMAMMVDSRTYNGTVSGIIRNSTGQTVANCFGALPGDHRFGHLQGSPGCDHQDQLCRKVSVWQRAGRRISGQGQAGAITRPFTSCQIILLGVLIVLTRLKLSHPRRMLSKKGKPIAGFPFL